MLEAYKTMRLGSVLVSVAVRTGRNGPVLDVYELDGEMAAVQLAGMPMARFDQLVAAVAALRAAHAASCPVDPEE